MNRRTRASALSAPPLILLVIGLASACPLRAQQPTASSLHFDVVSIKPSAPATARPRGEGNGCPSFKVTASRLIVECSPLSRLISYAFRIPPHRVTGPAWLDDGQRFDIEATFPAAPSNQVPEMLQTLLKDRFGLVVHEGTVDQEVFALIVDKGGLKLKEASPAPATELPGNDSAPGTTFLLGGIQTVRTDILNENGTRTIVRTNPRIGTTRQTENANHMFHLEAPNTTLEGLTDLLAPVGLPMDVVDMTGLEGRYGVTLDFSLSDAFASAASIPVGADPGSSRDPRSDMQNAILKGINDGLLKLGLRLEHRKGPVKTIVVDHAEKIPAAN